MVSNQILDYLFAMICAFNVYIIQSDHPYIDISVDSLTRFASHKNLAKIKLPITRCLPLIVKLYHYEHKFLFFFLCHKLIEELANGTKSI